MTVRALLHLHFLSTFSAPSTSSLMHLPHHGHLQEANFSPSPSLTALFERMAILACFCFLIISWCCPLRKAAVILTKLIQATFETLEQENRKISPLHIRGMSHSYVGQEVFMCVT